MMKKTNLLFFLVVVAYSLSAEPFSLLEDKPNEEMIRIGFQNDSFGLLPGVEWDDNESYVFHSRAALSSNFFLSSSLHSFTSRTEDPNTGSRIDNLQLGVNYWADTIHFGSFIVDGAVYLGVSVLGDLGTGALQSGWHNGVGVSRDIPETYDQIFSIEPAFAMLSTLTMDLLFTPFVTLEVNTALMQFSGKALIGLEYYGLHVAFGAQYHGGNSGSNAFDKTKEKETGYVLAAVCKSSSLDYELEMWPASGICNASILLALGKDEPPSGLDLDFGILLGSTFSSSVQFSKRLIEVRSQSFILCAGASSGWVGSEASGTEAPRAVHYRLGGAWETPTFLSLFRARVGVHGFLGIEELRALTVEESTVLDSRVLIGAGCSAELRASAIPFLPSTIGVGVRAWYFPLNHTIIDAETDFMGRSPALIDVFIFSEGS